MSRTESLGTQSFHTVCTVCERLPGREHIRAGFISTARKQGWNIIQALMENPEILIARLHAA